MIAMDHADREYFPSMKARRNLRGLIHLWNFLGEQMFEVYHPVSAAYIYARLQMSHLK